MTAAERRTPASAAVVIWDSRRAGAHRAPFVCGRYGATSAPRFHRTVQA